MTGSAQLGALWRRGLPPGVYEERPTAAARQHVRMDVAAFVGLAERGPIDQAIPLESFDAYRFWFGAPGGGRLLGQSVYLFFANGGRRCVVVRAVARGAKRALWEVPNLLAPSAPLRLAARDPGAWGDRLKGRFRYVLRPVPVTRLSNTQVILMDPTVVVGATIRRVYRGVDGGRVEELGRVAAVEPLASGERVATLAGITVPPGTLAALQELRIEVEIEAPELRERFGDLGLLPTHPRYLIAVLRGDPTGMTAVGAGSRLVSPIDEPSELTPNVKLLQSGTYEHVWSEQDRLTDGDDDGDKTDRSDFIQRDDGSSPLDLLDAYDDTDETQPISLVCLPDLVHPRHVEAATTKGTTTAAPFTLRFDACVRPTAVRAAAPVVDYPLLVLSHNLASAPDQERSALDWQAELVSRCEGSDQTGAKGRGRVAVLDLPPGIDAGQILTWRRAVRSDRGCAALYAPYLRAAPVEDPSAPLLTVPPCGAAAGIIARRERDLGVHVAPANELLHGVASLLDDGHLPDAGFLHEARVNLARSTEKGLYVLGSRTTSDDADWTHLSVRRLVHWLERQLAVDTRWAVFEPNDRILWSRLARGVERRLHALFSAGAFAGATPATSYFVHCDGRLNQRGVDGGRVLIEVGVAPSRPSEFIVFELSQCVDGTSRLEESRGV